LFFWLGTHQTHWLRTVKVPLFVSRRTLLARKTMPEAAGPYALDGGGFTELSMFGGWAVNAKNYISDVTRIFEHVGPAAWCPPQDWMCEPDVIAGCPKKNWPGTRLSVAEHQRRTVVSLLELRGLASELPCVPVLQGWTRDEYFRCWDLYESAGVDLSKEPLVAVGSVCRRQGTKFAASLLRSLAQSGLRLHAFGLKTKGLQLCGEYLESADSMAWSRGARFDKPLRGCTHKTCANCLRYALRWRRKILAESRSACRRPVQRGMF
jgi:hypothetical protein